MLYHPLAAESQLDLSERTYHVVHDSRTVEYSFGCNQSSDGSTRSSEFSGTGSVQDMQESNKNYLASLNHQQVNFHLSTTLPTLYMYVDVYYVNACIPLTVQSTAVCILFPCLHGTPMRMHTHRYTTKVYVELASACMLINQQYRSSIIVA